MKGIGNALRYRLVKQYDNITSTENEGSAWEECNNLIIEMDRNRDALSACGLFYLTKDYVVSVRNTPFRNKVLRRQDNLLVRIHKSPILKLPSLLGFWWFYCILFIGLPNA